jgi:hypothetical protein
VNGIGEINKIEVSKFWTWIDENGIIHTQVKPNAEIYIDDAKENSKVVNELGVDGTGLLVDSWEIKSMTRDARQFFTVRNRNSKINTIGIVTRSPVSKIIANFFLRVNKPDMPCKLFNSKEKALIWVNKTLKPEK